jgi:hypothetical protein
MTSLIQLSPMIFMLIYHVNAYNILVTCVGIAGSQNLIMYRLADMLAERGHNVID